MTQTPNNLRQQADDIAQAICVAFPDEPLPDATRLGCGYWMRNIDGSMEYIYQSECLAMEVFFRKEEYLGGPAGETPPDDKNFLHRLSLSHVPAKRWTEVVGVPLLSWLCVTWSRFQMTPQARAYYLPAYLLTTLPFLLVLPFESCVAPEGQVAPIEFVGDTMDMLLPPSDAISWDDLSHLPPEGCGPSRQPLAVSMLEDFLRYVQCLSTIQKRAIQRFVAFALRTYPLYIRPDRGSKQDMAVLTRFWLQPAFTG